MAHSYLMSFVHADAAVALAAAAASSLYIWFQYGACMGALIVAITLEYNSAQLCFLDAESGMRPRCEQ